MRPSYNSQRATTTDGFIQPIRTAASSDQFYSLKSASSRQRGTYQAPLKVQVGQAKQLMDTFSQPSRDSLSPPKHNFNPAATHSQLESSSDSEETAEMAIMVAALRQDLSELKKRKYATTRAKQSPAKQQVVASLKPFEASGRPTTVSPPLLPSKPSKPQLQAVT